MNFNLARSMRQAGESWETTAAFCGTSVYGVRKAIDPEFRCRRRERDALHEERMIDIRAAVAEYNRHRDRQRVALDCFRRRPTPRTLTALLHLYADQCEVDVKGPPWRARFTKAVRFRPGLLADDLGGEAYQEPGVIIIEGDVTIRCIADQFDNYKVRTC